MVSVFGQCAKDAAHPVGERQEQELVFVHGKDVALVPFGSQQLGIFLKLALVLGVHDPAVAWVQHLHKFHSHDGGAEEVANGVDAVKNYYHATVGAMVGHGEIDVACKKHRLTLRYSIFDPFTTKRERP